MDEQTLWGLLRQDIQDASDISALLRLAAEKISDLYEDEDLAGQWTDQADEIEDTYGDNA